MIQALVRMRNWRKKIRKGIKGEEGNWDGQQLTALFPNEPQSDPTVIASGSLSSRRYSLGRSQ